MNSGRDPRAFSFFIAFTGSYECAVLGVAFFYFNEKSDL